MEYAELPSTAFCEIKPKLERNDGLTVSAEERAEFEAWVKVEICDSLWKTFQDLVSEADWVDVTFGYWVLELKTVNTNYRCPYVNERTRPITKNTKGILGDVEKLKMKRFPRISVRSVAFPAEHSKGEWQRQLTRDSALVRER